MLRKRIISLFIALIVMFFGVETLNAYCEDINDTQTEISRQVDELLEDYDLGGSFDELKDITFGELIGAVLESLGDRLKAPFRLLGILLILTIFTAVLRSFGGSVLSKGGAELYDMACIITAVTVISSQMLTVFQRTLTVMGRGSGFITVFVPIFAAVTAACGGTVTAGAYDFLILAASEVFVRCAECYLMPLLSVIMVLSVSGSIYPERSLLGLTELIHKGTVWFIYLSMSLFTSFAALKCTVSGKTDGFAVKAVKFAVSGAVPIVGGAVSDAYSTVRGSFEIIRGGIGFVGMTAMLLIMLPPVLEIAVYRAVLRIGSVAADIFGAVSVSQLLKGFGNAAAVAQCLLICYSLMFMICTAIMLKSVG